MYFLHDRENEPDFLFPWLFSLIQHTNGNIRYAAVRMFENELGPLTVHIRCPDFKSSRLNSSRSDKILFGMYMVLIHAATYFSKPALRKYKYVSSLPSGPYKSAQLVLSHMADLCGKKYMAQLRDKLK